jgi:Icc protein
MTSFSFVHITDHHLGESETALIRGFAPAYAFRTVLRHIAAHVAERADFIVSTGDLVEPASDAAYETTRAILNINGAEGRAPGPLRVTIEGLYRYPMYFLPGNHDDRSGFIRHLFPRTASPGLVNATFVHRGVQFICLDWGPEAKAVADPTMLAFLARALAGHAPSIILMHHQPVPVGSRWLDEFIADDIADFWDIVRGQEVLGIFCGHAHTTHQNVTNGIPVFALRSTIYQFAQHDEPMMCLEPPHYRLVTVEGGQIRTQIFEVPL